MPQRILMLLLFCFAGAICFPGTAAGGELTVAVAANAAYAFEELGRTFEKNHGTNIIPIIGSSGKLTAQIEQGAPFDIFVSADMDYPRRLFERGFAISPPAVYAVGVPVLWTVKELDLSGGLEILRSDAVKKIALPQPDLAPYGRAAVEAMTKGGVLPSIEKRLVYGESISQVNQYVLSGAADAGFTALAVVLSPAMKEKGRWMELEPGSYEPIEQGIIILKYGAQNNREESKAFYDFMLSEAAGEILKQYGYRLHE